MVSVIIPSRNRFDWLKKVLPTYYSEKSITEIIIIDDCSHPKYELNSKYIKLIRNKKNMGAPYCRNLGVSLASNEYILFGEDDVFLRKGYCDNLFERIQNSNNKIISGQIYFLKPQEEIEKAYGRVTNYKSSVNIFDFYFHYGVRTNILPKHFINSVPYTHAIFLSEKKLLINHKFDEEFSKNSGFREESSAQLDILNETNKSAVIYNDLFCFHVSRLEVRSGGQRTPRLIRLLNQNKNTYKFFKKRKYRSTIDFYFACLRFTLFSIYSLYIYPLRHLMRIIK